MSRRTIIQEAETTFSAHRKIAQERAVRQRAAMGEIDALERAAASLSADARSAMEDAMQLLGGSPPRLEAMIALTRLALATRAEREVPSAHLAAGRVLLDHWRASGRAMTPARNDPAVRYLARELLRLDPSLAQPLSVAKAICGHLLAEQLAQELDQDAGFTEDPECGSLPAGRSAQNTA
jgi:hypothetical protein